MAIRVPPLTYADIEALPEDPSKRYELIDGELIVSPSAATPHQLTQGKLFHNVYGFSEERDLGMAFDPPFDIVLSERNAVVPDIVFVRKERLHIVGPKHIAGPPDLVVEIISPSSRRRDEIVKANLYARLGIPEYWLVDPDRRRFTVFELVDGTYQVVPQVDGRVVSRVLPGWSLDPAELFAVLDRLPRGIGQG